MPESSTVFTSMTPYSLGKRAVCCGAHSDEPEATANQDSDSSRTPPRVAVVHRHAYVGTTGKQHRLPVPSSIVNVRAIAAHEAGLTVNISMRGWRMDRRLHGEHQWGNRHSGTNHFLIPRNAVLVYRENVVEERGTGDEAIKMNPILPVPKHTGNPRSRA